MTPEEANAQLQALASRRAIANAMLQQSTNEPSTWGRDRFRHSPWEALANLATTYVNKGNLERADQNVASFQKQRQAEIAQALSQYEGAQGDPAVGPQGRMLAQQTLANTAMGPEQIAQAKITAALTPEKLTEVSPGASLYSQRTGKTVFTNPKPEGGGGLQKTDSGLVFDPVKGQYRDSTGKILTSDEVSKREREVAAAKATDVSNARSGPVNAGATNAQVEHYLQTGQAPALRGPVAQNRFWQAVNDRAIATGNTLASQEAQTRFRASLKPAFEQTQKQIAANSGFLETLHKNIANADSLAKRVGGDNSPAMNELFNKWKRKVTGDPDVAAFDFWNNSIQGEAAKIASGGVGSVSSSSDSQIQHQRENMNSAQNYASWRAAADAMLQEGGNRMDSLHGTLNDIQQSSQTSSGGGSPSGETAAERAKRLGL